jgi:serine/threonine protein kinase
VIDEKLSGGSTCIVWRCTRESDKRRFALKSLEGLCNDSSGVHAIYDEPFKEVAALSRFRSCANVVALEDVAVARKEPMDNGDNVAMGLVLQLHDLGSFAGCGHNRTFEQRLSDAPRLLHDLLVALCELHDLGYVHRDIKPGNVLVNGGGCGAASLADFGRCIHVNELDPHLVTTTLYSRAPEQCDALGYDCGVDVWAAAITVLAYLFNHGDARREFNQTYPHVYFRDLVERPLDPSAVLLLPPLQPPQSFGLKKEQEWLTTEIANFFAVYKSPSKFLARMCADAGLPSNTASRFLPFAQALDGMLTRNAGSRWNAHDARHVLGSYSFSFGSACLPWSHTEVTDEEPPAVKEWRQYKRSTRRTLVDMIKAEWPHLSPMEVSDRASVIQLTALIDLACVFPADHRMAIRQNGEEGFNTPDDDREFTIDCLQTFARTWRAFT